MTMDAAALSTPHCTVTADALIRVRDGQGRYFEPLMRVNPEKFAADTLDPRKSEDQAAILEAYVPLSGKKVLEIGTGCAVTHIVWRKKYGVDGWGVEPEGEGFDDSAAIGRDLIIANGLDPARILDAPGEALPFPDAHFDIVYSSNVLEHTTDPAKVLREAIRVLKPGGTMQIVCPNYLSYFDGHYAALHPPIFSNGFFRWWVKWIYRADPAFAATIRTQVNAVWAARELRDMARTVPLSVLSLGQETFVARMTGAGTGKWMGLGTVGKLVGFVQKIGLARIAAHVAIFLRGWTPLIITVRKSG
ncbi:MAG: class I SAM-dependent methyltransferase [Rhodobacteraceae bacterium]|nr:class I SAM-dependent methyltransferase [Paracoccaceae bacterium]